MDKTLLLLFDLLIRIQWLLCAGFTAAHSRPNYFWLPAPGKIIMLMCHDFHTLMCFSSPDSLPDCRNCRTLLNPVKCSLLSQKARGLGLKSWGSPWELHNDHRSPYLKSAECKHPVVPNRMIPNRLRLRSRGEKNSRMNWVRKVSSHGVNYSQWESNRVSKSTFADTDQWDREDTEAEQGPANWFNRKAPLTALLALRLLDPRSFLVPNLREKHHLLENT